MTPDTNKERAEFEAWLNDHPDARFWNTTDAMYSAFCGGITRAAKAPAAELVGWYAVSAEGMATLCVDREDAEKTAADGDKIWPKSGPYRAVQLYTAPPAPTEPWVSVEERLPAKNVEVLVAFAEDTLAATGQFTGLSADHHGWSYPKENEFWPGEHPDFPDGGWPTVTHWMPLPAPPQGAAKGATDGKA